MKINCAKNNTANNQKVLLQHRGFSLVEILVAVSVLSVLVIVVGAFQRDVFFLGSVLRGSASTAQDARSIMRTMTKELREAAPSSNGSYVIESAATSSIVFYADIDTDTQRERVRYFIIGRELRKGVIQPTGNPVTYPTNSETFTILASTISPTTSPSFRYYDSSYAGTSTSMTYPIDTARIRLIRFDLLLDLDANRSPVPRSYTTQVSIRNLKDNL